MKFLTPALFALSTTPTDTDAWSIHPSYFPSSLTLLKQGSPSSIIARQRALANRMLEQTDRIFQEADRTFRTRAASPRYELIDNEQKFEISIDVPGVRMEDIDVTLDDGYLSIRGQRMTKSETPRLTSQFNLVWSLDPAVDAEKFSASLNSGVLVVSAPKEVKKPEENVRKIPIMQAAAGATEDQLKVSSPNNDEADKAKLELEDEELLDLDDDAVSAEKETVKEPENEKEAEDPAAQSWALNDSDSNGQFQWT